MINGVGLSFDYNGETMAIPSSFRLLQWLRWRLWRNGLATLWRRSPGRIAVMLLLLRAHLRRRASPSASLGFGWLRHENIPFAGSIIGTLFDLLFLSLAVMLIFSTGIILYSSLFASAETAFLLTTPAAVDQVFAYKFQGAVAFSSWAFLLLGGPS